ncbi:MAG: DUF58 domain-containing protein [Acidimicrobiales bacterium]
MTEPLVPPSLLARLERLQLVNRRRLAGGMAGDHRSPRRGASLDYADTRDYYPGDDLRRLDVNALARLDKLLVTLFEAEDELTLRLMIDTSASMAGPKLAMAARLAAALGFAALVRRDIVSVHPFPGEIPPARFRGRGRAAALFDHLRSLEAGGGTPLVAAADRVLAHPGPPGLTIVFSDLLTPEWDEGLRRLPARRGDLVVVHVLAATDLDPDLSGDLELVDAETGARVEVSLSSSVLDDYRRLAARWVDDVAARVRSVDGAVVRVMADDDVERVILGRARDAGVVR